MGPWGMLHKTLPEGYGNAQTCDSQLHFVDSDRKFGRKIYLATGAAVQREIACVDYAGFSCLLPSRSREKVVDTHGHPLFQESGLSL